jgi:hypothetical protein
MSAISPGLVTLVALLIVAIFPACAQPTNPPQGSEDGSARPHGLALYFFTTPEYQREAVRLLLEEVNQVAKDLSLIEQLPITKSNLVSVLVCPPASDMIGNISTSNYTYYVREKRKFAGVDQMHLMRIWEAEEKDFLWPIERLDTNGAFGDATRVLAAGGIDTDALRRNSTIDIVARMVEGPRGKHFVPDYWITWSKGGKKIARLGFFEPTKTIRTFQIYAPEYVLRKPLEIPNLGAILRRGGAPKRLLQSMGLESTNTPNLSNTPPGSAATPAPAVQ